ncbi:MAG: DUF1553 domain-containing protein [Planctomycetes bacterium]|nr:DUF1553 domain-containing protein [Planctomycetota bacterium]
MNVRFAFLALSILLTIQEPDQADEPTNLSFNRDIRPILSNNCFFCHGQDDSNRKADLRLDTEAGQRVNQTVVPRSPTESLLIQRIFSEDDDVVMPPPESNKRLSNRERELLKRWIAEGAPFEKHWSWLPPQPTQPNSFQGKNPIDAFIFDKLRELGLKPSPEADRSTLIRRVTLDLIGLPPTVEEVDAFLSDESDHAYEKVVDRLLQSPHFGERMALPWLDAARYADTHGYQKDNHRSMWLWRDWVVQSINENMPFDQFTIEQLAGDLLESPSTSQRIATGFHRNHRINAEAGSIDEEFLAEYAADRVETTATVWLGLTIGCARCHDHKFDAITQKDFYQLVAFFNNINEKGVDGVGAAPGPELTVPLSGFDDRIESQRRKIDQLSKQLESRAVELREARREWEQTMEKALADPARHSIWNVPQPTNMRSNGKMEFESLTDGSMLVQGENPLNEVQTIEIPLEPGTIQSMRLEAMRHPSLTDNRFARSYDGSFVLSGLEVELHRPGFAAQKIKIREATADSQRTSWPIQSVLDESPDTGWSIDPKNETETHRAFFVFDHPLVANEGQSLIVRLRYESKEEQSIIGRFRLSFHADPQADFQSNSWLPSSVIKALITPRSKRSSEQEQQLHDSFIQLAVDPELDAARTQLQACKRELNQLIAKSSVRVMVMQEARTPRKTFVNVRGAYDKLGEEVFTAMPSSLPQPSRQSISRPLNRLDLARWLVEPENPLTARVAVNRYWQMYFGNGLVRTTEDFGTQGDWPSHPELLDWLATEFIRQKWDVKAIQRLIVTSSTYRQSSKVNSQLLEIDPENRWLARGPRFRLPAHIIRDQALASSGLLVPAIGGPSVKPYQPPGLWEGVAGINSNTTRYRQDSGPNLYRRSLYTYWKRAVPPPAMMIFDAADREVCNVKRRLTNTPLQALAVLNDPTYVEASRWLASSVLTESEKDRTSDSDRIQVLFRRVLARRPDARELSRLERSIATFREHFSQTKGSAEQLVQVGESQSDVPLNSNELAAWTTLASVILNLDETLTKE